MAKKTKTTNTDKESWVELLQNNPTIKNDYYSLEFQGNNCVLVDTDNSIILNWAASRGLT